MKWSIRKQVDGVITDDPKKYLEVCKNYRDEKVRMKWGQLGLLIIFHTLAVPVWLILKITLGFEIDGMEICRLLEESRP